MVYVFENEILQMHMLFVRYVSFKTQFSTNQNVSIIIKRLGLTSFYLSQTNITYCTYRYICEYLCRLNDPIPNQQEHIYTYTHTRAYTGLVGIHISRIVSPL